MLRLDKFIQSCARDQRGQAFVEYALLIGVVSVGLFGAISALGGLDLSGLFTAIEDVIP